MSANWSQFAIAVLAGAGVLYAIKAAAFYILLGRTTLHEPAGSGFIDLDMFEQEMFERASGCSNEDFQHAIREFRRRYGRRVPAHVIRTFVDNQLSSIQKEKKQILADADGKVRQSA
jgi:hypothetical protein